MCDVSFERILLSNSISSYTDGLITTQDLDAFSTNVTSNIGGTLWKRDEIIEFVNSIDLGQSYSLTPGLTRQRIFELGYNHFLNIRLGVKFFIE